MTRRFRRQLFFIHKIRQDVPNVSIVQSPRDDKTFQTSIPLWQIRKARREGEGGGGGGVILLCARCEKVNRDAHTDRNGGFGKQSHQMAVVTFVLKSKYIYTSNSFLYSAFYNFMYTFKGFNKIHQPFPDM